VTLLSDANGSFGEKVICLPEIRHEPGTVGMADWLEIGVENPMEIGAVAPTLIVPLRGKIDSAFSPSVMLRA
jgi:hypothetical protein